jgi:TolB-like protein/tetratricopeptide (TPR) repeat protein
MADLLARLQRALAQSYRVERQVGEGGMATVFKAEDLKHGRQVAIKVLSPDLGDSIGRRFPHEIRLTAALQHPHILALHDSGEADGLLYYVMPYVEGETLRQRLERETQLPIEDAIALATELAEALDYAHGQGVVHRDVKPANVLLSGGHAQLADFGIARALSVASESRMTTRDAVVGTPFYMSPEQATNAALDGRADQYSLACMVYEMLGGQPPFTGPSWESVVHQHLTVEPPPVTNLRPKAPAEMAAVLARAMAKAPADRYPSASAFAKALAQAGRETVALRAPAVGRKSVSRRAIVIAVGALAVTAAAVLFWMRMHFGVAHNINSVAVMPLANLSGDPNQLYFADGMTEELIGELSRIRSLRVISRTSVMGYRDKPKTIRQVARELGVNAVLEGSIRLEGSRVRVTASLVDATRDRELWSQTYDRELRDVLTLQREIARAVVERVRTQLTPEERSHLAQARAVEPRAYDAYLRGTLLLDRVDESNYRTALGHFEEALRIDSTYAEAWAGLGASYYYMSSMFIPATEAMPKAREASRRALTLDPGLGSAHATLGMVSSVYDWQWVEGEKHFREALNLSPGDASVHWLCGTRLGFLGRFDEALDHLRTAQSLDPLSAYPVALEIWFLYLAGRHQEGVNAGHRALLRDSTYAVTWYNLAQCHAALGHFDEAIRCARRAVGLSDAIGGRVILGCLYVRSGRMEEAREAFRRLEGEPTGRVARARMHLALGEKGLALDMLERSLTDHEEDVATIRVDPAFRSLRGDPRFEAVLARVGF